MFQDIRRRFRHILGPMVGLSALGYFAYHTVEGDRGLLAWLRLRGQIADAEQQLAQATSDRQTLEHRVLLLRPDHLDPDMLEERARALDDLGRPGDIVVFEKK